MERVDPFKPARKDGERYRVHAEAVTDYAVYMLNAQGIILSWSPGHRRYQGHDPGDLLGAHFSCFYPEEDRKAGLPDRALVIANREDVFEHEGWRLRKDGSRFWAHTVIHAVRAPLGTLVGYTKVTHDLSKRRAAQDALRQTDEQFRILVQSIIDYAIYMTDIDGVVATWNPGAERIQRYRPDEIIGRNFACFYTPSGQAEGLPLRTLQIAGRIGRYEEQGWRVRQDGSLFWANVIIDAIRNGEGELTGFANVVRDLNESLGSIPPIASMKVRYE